MKENKILLYFSDEIGYTEFFVDTEWYEKNKKITDMYELYQTAMLDETSGFVS